MSDSHPSLYEQAIRRFDELNAEDPNTIIVDGVKHPKELWDSKQMTKWVNELYPNAPESVRLAARCQHICRWEIPRSSYPEGRAAYLKWRNDLKKFHADKSEEVLREIGYDDKTIEKVRNINLKKALHKDSDVQSVEDALCMVFLDSQFEGYLDKWEEDKIIRILRKTWAKMSAIAKERALTLKYSQRASELIHQALSD